MTSLMWVVATPFLVLVGIWFIVIFRARSADVGDDEFLESTLAMAARSREATARIRAETQALGIPRERYSGRLAPLEAPDIEVTPTWLDWDVQEPWTAPDCFPLPLEVDIPKFGFPGIWSDGFNVYTDGFLTGRRHDDHSSFGIWFSKW